MTAHDDLTRFDPRATYGSAAALYDALGQEYWRFMFERTVARLDLKPGMRVLDAACGSAPTAVLAAERVAPDGVVVAVDYGEEMLDLAWAKAAQYGLSNVEFRLADMTALGEPDESFVAVLCALGVFFVEDMPALLRELWRMVKPGGQLAITNVGPRLFEPLTGLWAAQMRIENPNVQIVRPWERANTPEIVAGLFEAARIPDANIWLEHNELLLKSPEDWWRMVMGTGLRRYTLDLGDEGAARIRAHNLGWIAAHGLGFSLDFVYALATKRT